MARKKNSKVTEETGTVTVLSVKPEEAEAAKVETAETEPGNSSTPEEAVEILQENKTVAKTTTEKKARTVKSADDKPAAKKTAAKKEMKVRAVVEYQGKQVEEKDIIANVKKAWTKSGKKVRDIKSVDLYIKPEEYKVYYVINGTDTGAVAF